MKRTTLILLSILLSLVSLAQAENTIRGKVQNSQTGDPVSNANVYIKDTEDGTTTNTNGVFLIETNASYPVTVIIDHIGYSSIEKTAYDSRVLQVDLWPKTLELAPVDVSVARLPSHYDVSSPKETLGGSEIRARGVQDFQELTRSISSVVVSTGMDGSQTISVRGSNANETPIYLDGVKINDSFTNIADLAQVNMEDVESIDVIKGASTLPYEVGAFGGVVNIYSHVPTHNKLLLSSSLDLNNGNNATHTGQFSYVNDHISANTQLTKRMRNFQTFTDETRSEYLFGSGVINWKMALGSLHLKGSWQEAQTRQAAGGDFTTNTKNQLFNVRYTGALPWLGRNWQIGKAWREDSFGVSFWSLGTNNPNYEQSPEGANSSFRLAKLIKHGPLESLVQLAGSTEDYSGPSSTYIDSIFEKDMNLELHRDNHSLTFISKFNAESEHPAMDLLSFEFGLRYDDINTEYHWDEERRYYNPDGTERHPAVIVVKDDLKDHYLLAKRLGLRMEGKIKRFNYISYFSLGNNNRLPTLQDEFFRQSTTVLLYQNSELSKEIVNTVDVGLDFTYHARPGSPFTKVDGRINVFDNGYVNKLSYKYSPGQPPIPYNTLAASISGVEISGKLHLPSKRGSLYIGSIFLDLSDPTIFIGKPSYRHTLGLTLIRGNLTYSGNMWWDGRKVYLQDDGLYIEPKHNLDLSVDYKQNWNHFSVTSTLAAKNIFNFSETQESLLVNDQGYLITFYDTFQLLLNFRLSLF